MQTSLLHTIHNLSELCRTVASTVGVPNDYQLFLMVEVIIKLRLLILLSKQTCWVKLV